jgi:pimeloyl-ACP methyl ester carboxylesterase
MGSSLGGLISLVIADRFPDRYDMAISMSGTVGWGSITLQNETILERYMAAGKRDFAIYVDSGGDGTCGDADMDGIDDDDPQGQRQLLRERPVRECPPRRGLRGQRGSFLPLAAQRRTQRGRVGSAGVPSTRPLRGPLSPCGSGTRRSRPAGKAVGAPQKKIDPASASGWGRWKGHSLTEGAGSIFFSLTRSAPLT